MKKDRESLKFRSHENFFYLGLNYKLTLNQVVPEVSVPFFVCVLGFLAQEHFSSSFRYHERDNNGKFNRFGPILDEQRNEILTGPDL